MAVDERHARQLAAEYGANRIRRVLVEQSVEEVAV